LKLVHFAPTASQERKLTFKMMHFDTNKKESLKKLMANNPNIRELHQYKVFSFNFHKDKIN